MPTANITWTNRSTSDSPTGTKIERTEGFPFGHANAPAPVEIANGNTGGLDPTLSGAGAGNYSDTTISGDTSYAYRVSTLKGDEVATSIATPMEFIYDSVNDLGYPGGLPETTAQYTISTAPFLHVDMNRSSTGYLDDFANSGQYTQMTEGFAGQIRHGEFVHNSSAYSNSAGFATFDLGNGIVRNFAHQPHGASRSYSMYPTNNLDSKSCADGVTAFFVMTTNQMSAVGLSDSKPGHAAYSDGVHHANSDLTSTVFSTMGVSTAWSASHAGPTIGHHTPVDLHVLGFRVNNDAAAFATGNIQGQLFDGGDLVGTSANRHSASYHNNPANPDYTNNLGAGGFNQTYPLSFLSSGWNERMMGECLYFDSALSLSDMNTVNAYLCAKYNIIPTTIAANDLVN